ncbi:transcription elongation factor 1 family protein [Sporobolomyces koalae]|uniref:transcription elongation factor 1 family protein n=1 Tax=Sporobolomyces koalae TaxID=500713 RepID=UPI0031745F04
MGKRKSSKKPQTRVKQVLDKSFRCIFCAHQGSVTCKMDNKLHVGRLDCKDCGQTFSMDISHLDAPVDVYSSWIDAASAVNSTSRTASHPTTGPISNRQDPTDRRPASSSTAATTAKKVKKRSRDDDDESEPEDEEDDDDRAFIADSSSRKKTLTKGSGRQQRRSDDEDDDDNDDDDDLPDLDISQKQVKRTRVVQDDDDDDDE